MNILNYQPFRLHFKREETDLQLEFSQVTGNISCRGTKSPVPEFLL